MSVNAVALRRIIRSLGQHVSPSGTEGPAANAPGGTCLPLDIPPRSGRNLPTARGGRSDVRGRRLQLGEQRRFQHTTGGGRVKSGIGFDASNYGGKGQGARRPPIGSVVIGRGVRCNDNDRCRDGAGGDPAARRQAAQRARTPGSLGQRADRASDKDESKARASPIADERAKKIAHDEHPQQRPREQETVLRDRSEHWPKTKTEGEPRPGYYRAVASSAKMKARRAATSRNLLKERQTHSENRAWHETFAILSRESQPVKHQFGKRMEKLSLPQGIVVRWSRDPGESILEIFQRTGCTVRAFGSTDDGTTFPSFTLSGTPGQNEAATQLIRDSDLLIAFGQDDLNASRKFADHKVHIEIADDLSINDDINEVSHHNNEDDELPLNGIVRNVASKRSYTGDTPPTRAVWARLTAQGNPLQLRWDNTNNSWSLIEDITRFSRDTPGLSNQVALALQVRALTMFRPLQGSHSPSFAPKAQHTNLLVADKLVKLLTDTGNAALITTESLELTFRYLVRNMQFPAIRSLLDYLESSKVEVRADALGPLFLAATTDTNANAFCYYTKFMQKRGIKPIARVWTAFKELTQKMNPAKAGLVYQRMLDLGLYENTETKYVSFERICPDLLLAYIRTHAPVSFVDFVRDTVGTYSQITRMSTVAANTMIDAALKVGRMNVAFEIVDTLVKQGGKPDTFTLNNFLTAVRREESLEMAATVLKKFHDLRVHHRPMTVDEKSMAVAPDSSQAANDVPPLPALPRTRDLSVYLNDISFSLLLKTAWERRSWNMFRVFWRYACMFGYRDRHLSGEMIWSLQAGLEHQWQAVPRRRHVDGKLVKGEIPEKVSRAMMWDVWAARFAIGLETGLKDTHGDFGSVVSLDFKADIVDSELSSNLATPDDKHFEYWRDILDRDQAEAQSLRPLLSISTLAEQAWRKDREWKNNLLGLPKGLENPLWRKNGQQAMLEVMLREAIEVLVTTGDGTQIRA